MGKTILAVIVGFVAWFAIALGIGSAMRASWPAYAAVADAMTFTLPMMLARLGLGVLGSLVSGWLAARLATHPKAATVALGIALLVIFIPQHIQLWDKFPLWYHTFFLCSLIPLAMLGGLRRAATSRRPQPA
jgi:asparagine N-glycosylation enzyme membrane subunit Stt3